MIAGRSSVGHRQVTTLANGSPAKLGPTYDPETDDDERCQPIRGNLNAQIARRVGKTRCWVMSWPDGCKDAKDTVQKRGRDAVRFAIEHAEPYPIEGTEVITDEAIAGDMTASAIAAITGDSRTTSGCP